jgi:hypothetical protein
MLKKNSFVIKYLYFHKQYYRIQYLKVITMKVASIFFFSLDGILGYFLYIKKKSESNKKQNIYMKNRKLVRILFL